MIDLNAFKRLVQERTKNPSRYDIRSSEDMKRELLRDFQNILDVAEKLHLDIYDDLEKMLSDDKHWLRSK